MKKYVIIASAILVIVISFSIYFFIQYKDMPVVSITQLLTGIEKDNINYWDYIKIKKCLNETSNKKEESNLVRTNMDGYYIVIGKQAYTVFADYYIANDLPLLTEKNVIDKDNLEEILANKLVELAENKTIHINTDELFYIIDAIFRSI